jgi:hypothetical protein
MAICEFGEYTSLHLQTMTQKLAADSVVCMQENHIVTDGIFRDENVIFDDVTPEWVEYCQKELEFEIPKYARSEEAKTEQDIEEAR